MKVPPLLKFYGGKEYIKEEIVKLMVPHLHYVEPYCGGLKVLCARDPKDPRLLWPGRTSDNRKADGVSEVANDLNDDLINLYAVVRDPKLFPEFQDGLPAYFH